MFIEEMTKVQLEEEILFNEDGLYEKVNEDKFYGRGCEAYTVEELREVVANWIMEGDESYAF